MKSRRISLGAFVLGCGLAAGTMLSGCADGHGSFSRGLMSAPPKAEAPAPAAQTVKAAPTPMDALRALAPPTGLSTPRLFADSVSNTDDRISRVEAAVQSLRDDFDTVVPSIVRLVAVEQDMKDLVGQLHAITGMSPSSSDAATPAMPAAAPAAAYTAVPLVPDPVLAAAAPSAPASAPAAAAPPPAPEDAPMNIIPSGAAPTGGGVQGLHVADYADKTRLVLNLASRPIYSAEMQENGQQLVINLPRVDWSWNKDWDSQKGALISGFRHEGTELIVDLSSAADIRGEQVVPVNGGFQLMIDLVSSGVHH